MVVDSDDDQAQMINVELEHRTRVWREILLETVFTSKVVSVAARIDTSSTQQVLA
jgi:hypothetical protein